MDNRIVQTYSHKTVFAYYSRVCFLMMRPLNAPAFSRMYVGKPEPSHYEALTRHPFICYAIFGWCLQGELTFSPFTLPLCPPSLSLSPYLSRLLFALLLGQVLSLLLCGTGVTSQLLEQNHSLSVPTTQVTIATTDLYESCTTLY